MPIEGPVRELALSDLLQLLYLSRRTGSLLVRDESGGRGVVLELDNGAIIGASASSPETRLGRLLIGSGRATEVQISRALEAQRASPDLRLGEILVETRALRAAEVERHLRFQVEDAVFDLMRWTDGYLRFEERPGGWPGRRIQLRLPTDAILMDAARRLDEWTEVTASAPEPDPVPRLSAQDVPGGSKLLLQPGEWEVLAKVDGTTGVRAIALSLGRSELEIARAVYSLASSGVVEVGGRGRQASPHSGEQVEAEVRRIESLIAEGTLDEAERRIHSVLALRPGAAGLYVLRGRVLAGKAEWKGAIRAFEQSIEVDPLSAPAYFYLARTAIRLGDLERANAALGTYRRLPDGSVARRNAADRMSEGLAQLVGAMEESIE